MRSTEIFLAPWQAADYMGLKIEAVYELLEKGELQGEKIEGRWRIRKSVIDAWLDEEVSSEELEKLASKMKYLDEEQAKKLLEEQSPES
ncbi:MAG: DNA-binding protein [Nitrospinota bacterium]|nr:MAG: DNA-binding protein [Nitrospinota bacterium]